MIEKTTQLVRQYSLALHQLPRMRIRAVAACGLLALLSSCGGGGGDSTAGGGNGPGNGGSPQALPTVSLSTPTPIVILGQSVALTWTSSNATQCSADGAWQGSKSTTGSESVTPTENPAEFRISCAGAGGSAQSVINVTVQPAKLSSSASASSPVVSFEEISADLSQSAVLDSPVLLEKFSEGSVNAAALTDQVMLKADLSAKMTYRITLQASPTGPVEVTVNTGTRFTSASGVWPAIYYRAGENDDNDARFLPLATTLEANGDLHAILPVHAFVPNDTGQAIATIKVGTAEAFEKAVSPAAFALRLHPLSAARIQTNDDVAATMPCPLGSCTETSMRNISRKTTSGARSSRARQHYGIDLRAAIGLQIKGIPGSTLQSGTNSENNTCGRHLMLYSATFNGMLKYCHLSEIDPSLLDGQKLKEAGTPLGDDNKVGLTGNSGTLMLPPHLHLEVSVPTLRVCAPDDRCHYIYNIADPFPYMISSFEIKEISNKNLQAPGTYTIEIEAKDSNGVAVMSDVGNANENVPGDPTRKLCLSSDHRDTVFVANPPFIGPQSLGLPTWCSPWGKPIVATSSSNQPTTTLTVRYSTRPDLPLAQDPLSAHVDSVTLKGITGRTLTVYSTYGGPISPIAIPYTFTSVTTNESGTTSQTSSDPNFRPGANFTGGPGSPLTYSMCKLGDEWIDASYEAAWDSEPSALGEKCTGTPGQDRWRSEASVAGGILHARFTNNTESDTTCDHSVGAVVNIVNSSMSSAQTQEYTIDLETGVGQASFNVDQSHTYSQTAARPWGEVTTTTTTTNSTGRADGSWTPSEPQSPLRNTGITKSTITLAEGQPIPSYCKKS